MHKNPLTVIFWPLHALARPLRPQDIYRCGDSYSQQPCPGGTVVAGRGCAQRWPAVADQRRPPSAMQGLADAMEKAQAEGRGQAASQARIFRAKAAGRRRERRQAGRGPQGEEAGRTSPRSLPASRGERSRRRRRSRLRLSCRA